jgi:choline dehydrogenase-like flavoprotein
MNEIPQDSSAASPGADVEDFDVVVIGAGISGIGAAHRIAERDPSLRYVILERRTRIGGTWDVFRYPGVRCDTSMYTLCFAWEPWTRTEAMAGGEQIRGYVVLAAHDMPKAGTSGPWKVRQNYLTDVIAHRFGRIDDAIVFGTI